MAEGKKRLFHRTSVEKAYQDLIKRVKNIKKQDLLGEVTDVIVFGSFVNSDLEQIHDLDVCFLYKRNPNGISTKEYENLLVERISKIKPNSNYSFFEMLIYDHIEIERYLRNKSAILSVHGNDSLVVALFDKHIFLMKNGKVLDEPYVEEGYKK